MSGQHSTPSKCDEQARCYEEFLRQLFSGHLTPETAAPKLAAIAVSSPGIDPEECEEDLQLFWSDVLAAVLELPGRVKIVAKLIFCMSQLPPPTTKSGKQLAVNDGGERVWENTPTLGWGCMMTGILSVDTDPATRPAITDRFVALNTLIALLMTCNQDRFDYRSFTLYTFRNGLEYSASAPKYIVEVPDYQKCHVVAATKLVEIAGSIIYEWDIEFESGPLIGDKGRGSKLWDGKHGFCKGRWELWKRRFFEISADGSFGDKVEDCARKAGEVMAKIDGRPGE